MNDSTGWTSTETTTVLETFQRAMARDGQDFEFIDYDGVRHTYGDLDARSTAMAHGLRAAGARPGECVVSVLDNRVEQPLLLLACSKIGAIHVPLNTAYKGEFLRHQIEDSGAVIIIAEGDYADRVLDIEDELVAAKQLFILGDGVTRRARRLAQSDFDALDLTTDEPLGYVCKPSDVAMLIYTAGTTGPSKGCMVSQNYVCNMARQLMTCQLYQPGDVIWTPLPGFHLNQYTATIVSAMLVGGKAAISPRYSVSRFWQEIERSGATIVQILATMISFTADAEETEAEKRCFGQVRIVCGAPFPPALQNKWKTRFGVKYAGSIGFGLTECAIVTSVAMDEVGIPEGSSGRRNDVFDVRIVDDEDRELPAGEPGEIMVRPRKPHVMFEGFWNRPAETMKQLRNFWYHTGDIGKFDAEGFFYFVDRKKDYLRRRGENISSLEIEHAFRRHPAIVDVAVHAVLTDAEDDVKVTCIITPDIGLTEADLCQWSIDNLPYFAVPRFVEFRLELPRNPVGRVLKYQLRDEGVTPSTWDRETSGLTMAKR